MAQLQQLNADQLHRAAPSIFASAPWEGVSDRYAFVPTNDIIARMEGEFGLVPVAARESRTRHTTGKAGFQRHEVRMVHSDALKQGALIVGDTYPTVNLTNAHDTGASLAIDAGLYRLVCANGMMVPDNLVPSMRIRHTGDMTEVLEGVYSVVEQSTGLSDLVREYQGVAVTPAQQLAFATAAMELRESALEVTPAQLLRPRRWHDAGISGQMPKPDLYTTLNVVQEALIKGGQRTRTATGRRTSTRAVTDIGADQRINKALFTLAEALKLQIAA